CAETRASTNASRSHSWLGCSVKAPSNRRHYVAGRELHVVRFADRLSGANERSAARLFTLLEKAVQDDERFRDGALIHRRCSATHHSDDLFTQDRPLAPQGVRRPAQAGALRAVSFGDL